MVVAKHRRRGSLPPSYHRPYYHNTPVESAADGSHRTTTASSVPDRTSQPHNNTSSSVTPTSIVKITHHHHRFCTSTPRDLQICPNLQANCSQTRRHAQLQVPQFIHSASSANRWSSPFSIGYFLSDTLMFD
ncbi:hypothetical protein RYX36_011989 [Vicia faba]